MRKLVMITGPLLIFVLLSGCAHKSYHPWLGEDVLVEDDRMAGVWQGIEPDGRETDETEIFLVRAAVQKPADESKPGIKNDLQGYYAVTWVDNDSVELPATIEDPFVKPKNLFAALYRIDDVLLAQMWGHPAAGDPLVVPMYVIYKVQLEDEILTLYDLQLDSLEMADLHAEKLLFEANEDDPILFFSPTEKLQDFIRKHLHEEKFFNSEPSLKLKRIRDLSGMLLEEFGGYDAEILEPVP